MKDTFEMTPDQVNGALFPNPPLDGERLDFTFAGVVMDKLGKTGLYVEIYDTIADKVFYSSWFYSGKDSYAKGEQYSKRIKWLVPLYIPESVYEVRVSLRDWYNHKVEYANIYTEMTIKDYA